ncbi:unnamed protein product [Haemonchus placei]|uniref:Uncharacterized protein n=1 Tax=Haemonchus placei TaxID=6290 RepID=A0A3P7WZY2_HAEPC|nr:unnamed protein product [Haemonchus placei]
MVIKQRCLRSIYLIEGLIEDIEKAESHAKGV